MGIEFKLDPVDCDQFCHGCGENWSDVKIVFRILGLPFEDWKWDKFYIPFYLTKGICSLLLYHCDLSNSDILNSQNARLLIIRPDIFERLKSKIMIPIHVAESRQTWTHVHVLMTQIFKFQGFIATQQAFLEQNETGLTTVTETLASWKNLWNTSHQNFTCTRAYSQGYKRSLQAEQSFLSSLRASSRIRRAKAL